MRDEPGPRYSHRYHKAGHGDEDPYDLGPVLMLIVNVCGIAAFGAAVVASVVAVVLR